MDDPKQSSQYYFNEATATMMSVIQSKKMSEQAYRYWQGNSVPQGLGICTDDAVWCAEAPWHLFDTEMIRNWVATLMLLLTSVVMKVTLVVMLSLGWLVGRIAYLGKPVRMELTFTSKGPKLMYTLNGAKMKVKGSGKTELR